MDDFSLVRFNVINFFAVVINARPFAPIHTLLYKLVVSIVESIKENDSNTLKLQSLKKELRYIYENTDDIILNNLSVTELICYKNLDSHLNKELDLNGATFNMADLYQHLDGVTLRLTAIVINLARDYSIDIPYNALGNTGNTRLI